MKESPRDYHSDLGTISYEAGRCIHAGACVRGLPGVFNTRKKPWIQAGNGTISEIMAVVDKCPSGALHFSPTDKGSRKNPPSLNTVTVVKDGPLYVRGNIRVENRVGEVLLQDTRMALCRCGASANKPFCDNSHKKVLFGDSGQLPEKELKTTGAFEEGDVLTVVVNPNGSLRLSGPFTITGTAEADSRYGEVTSLCRCGASAQKPFCDAAHKINGFVAE